MHVNPKRYFSVICVLFECILIQRSALPVLFAFLRALYKDLSYFIYLGFPLRDLKVNQMILGSSLGMRRSATTHGYFRVPKTLTFKMRPNLHDLSCENEFICMRMKNHFHIKGWVLNLLLKVHVKFQFFAIISVTKKIVAIKNCKITGWQNVITLLLLLTFI